MTPGYDNSSAIGYRCRIMNYLEKIGCPSEDERGLDEMGDNMF